MSDVQKVELFQPTCKQQNGVLPRKISYKEFKMPVQPRKPLLFGPLGRALIYKGM